MGSCVCSSIAAFPYLICHLQLKLGFVQNPTSIVDETGSMVSVVVVLAVSYK